MDRCSYIRRVGLRGNSLPSPGRPSRPPGVRSCRRLAAVVQVNGAVSCPSRSTVRPVRRGEPIAPRTYFLRLMSHFEKANDSFAHLDQPKSPVAVQDCFTLRHTLEALNQGCLGLRVLALAAKNGA